MRLTLYYPDRLEYYVSRGKADTVHRGSDFEAADPPRADNPYGVIPVVHFRKERRGYISELGPSIRSQQDAVNKTMADMMVNNEFNALRERWIISSFETDAALKSAPNEILVIPAAGEGEQNTEVGQFDETPPTGFLEVMEKLASGMAVTSRTPKHYFWAQGETPRARRSWPWRLRWSRSASATSSASRQAGRAWGGCCCGSMAWMCPRSV
jgi:hypothetical protein